VTFALLLLAFWSPGLDAIRNEANLERRASAALKHAAGALKQARAAYAAGDHPGFESGLSEVKAAVELVETSLEGTGKDARRNPRHFKRAEIDLRDLMRRLESFRQEVNVADRQTLEGTRATMFRVHEELLLAIMGSQK
jgi:hypothetical protein